MGKLKITDYTLSCGNVFKKTFGSNWVELYKEHNTFHVRRFSLFIDGYSKVQDAWLCFDNLKEAKKCFNRQCDLAKALL